MELPRLHNRTDLIRAERKDLTLGDQDASDQQTTEFSTLIPRDILIPHFKKRTLNPIKIKDIYLSKKRQQLYRQKDVQRRYDEHRSITKDKPLTPEPVILPRVIKNLSFFKINERVKFNSRFVSLKK